MERSALRKLLLAAGEGDSKRIEQVLGSPIHRAVSAEEVVVEAGIVSEDRLCELLSLHFGLPLVHVDPASLDPVVVGLINPEVANLYCIIPYRRYGEVLVLAMGDPQDAVAVSAVQFATGLKIRPAMAARSEILSALAAFGRTPGEAATLRTLKPKVSHDKGPGPLAEGTILQGRYAIERIVGHGGMGTIYQATDTTLGGKRVAIKEMIVNIPDPEERQATIQQFQREASILATLEHPGLVDVTHYFEESSKQYLVMAFIEGKTLGDLVNESETLLPAATVIGWIEEVCDVLEYLHNRNPPILFRDLKPTNVMLDSRGRIRLIDFGLARRFDAKDVTSTLLKGAGTPGFAPLEQYGKAGATDMRTDIYAAGATLYSILTRTIPPSSVDLATHDETLVAPSRFNKAISPQLETVILTMMALHKEDRYQSVAAARQALHMTRPTADKAALRRRVKPRFCNHCGEVVTHTHCIRCGTAVDKTSTPDTLVSERIHVLVVDDDETTRTLVEGMLEDQQYVVLQADNGEEGLRLALQHVPDLIISDVNMPGLDGMALCRELSGHQVTSDIPVLLLTSCTEVGDETRGLEAGADDYVAKPIVAERLMARVQALLRRSASRRPKAGS